MFLIIFTWKEITLFGHFKVAFASYCKKLLLITSCKASSNVFDIATMWLLFEYGSNYKSCMFYCPKGLQKLYCYYHMFTLGLRLVNNKRVVTNVSVFWLYLFSCTFYYRKGLRKL